MDDPDEFSFIKVLTSPYKSNKDNNELTGYGVDQQFKETTNIYSINDQIEKGRTSNDKDKPTGDSSTILESIENILKVLPSNSISITKLSTLQLSQACSKINSNDPDINEYEYRQYKIDNVYNFDDINSSEAKCNSKDSVQDFRNKFEVNNEPKPSHYDNSFGNYISQGYIMDNSTVQLLTNSKSLSDSFQSSSNYHYTNLSKTDFDSQIFIDQGKIYTDLSPKSNRLLSNMKNNQERLDNFINNQPKNDQHYSGEISTNLKRSYSIPTTSNQIQNNTMKKLKSLDNENIAQINLFNPILENVKLDLPIRTKKTRSLIGFSNLMSCVTLHPAENDGIEMVPVGCNENSQNSNQPSKYPGNNTIVCFECKKAFSHPCPKHHLALVTNKSVSRYRDAGIKARSNIPWPLRLGSKQSSSKSCQNGGNRGNRTPSEMEFPLGVFSEANLPKGLVFGSPKDVEWMAELYSKSQVLAQQGENKALRDTFFQSWFGFLRHTEVHEEANIRASMFRGQLLYCTTKDISSGAELVVYDEKDEKDQTGSTERISDTEPSEIELRKENNKEKKSTQVKTSEVTYSCKLCNADRNFRYKSGLENHLKNFHGIYDVKNITDSVPTTSSLSLKEKIRITEIVDSVIYSVCYSSFVKRYELYLYRIFEYLNSNYVDIFGNSDGDIWELPVTVKTSSKSNNKNNISNSKPFCNKLTNEKYSNQSQTSNSKFEITHSIIKNSYTVSNIKETPLNKNSLHCVTCKKWLITLTDLFIDDFKHFYESPMQCGKCYQRFNKFEDLICHIDFSKNSAPMGAVDSRKLIKNLACKDCNAVLKHIWNVKVILKQHMLKKHNWIFKMYLEEYNKFTNRLKYPGPYEYDIPKDSGCPLCFQYLEDGDDHFDLHTQYDAYNCSLCHVWFNSKSELDEHKQCHNDPQIRAQIDTGIIGDNIQGFLKARLELLIYSQDENNVQKCKQLHIKYIPESKIVPRTISKRKSLADSNLQKSPQNSKLSKRSANATLEANLNQNDEIKTGSNKGNITVELRNKENTVVSQKKNQNPVCKVYHCRYCPKVCDDNLSYLTHAAAHAMKKIH